MSWAQDEDLNNTGVTVSAPIRMSSKKKSLGTVVECAEGPEESSSREETTSVDGKFIDDRASSGEGSSVLPHKKRWNGSRLSLASLFTFSTMAQRERARTSCGADSHSSGDLRNFSLSTHNISNRRFAMNDLESCSVEATDSSDDPLLINDGEIIDQNGKKMRECPLCYMRQPIHNFPKLIGCNHRSCRLCLMQYVELEIMENRVEVTCPECSAHLHPSDVALLVGGRTALIEKYEQFSLRRFLMTEPDTRFCPAPDCQYAVIASGCAACPQLKCARDECGTLFCYHCKGVWHANQTCDEARRQRGPNKFRLQRLNSGSIDAQLKPGDIKACPRCRTYIVKMDDGSCNHMVCAMCSAEFCWLCLKEISDLHYLSPTGCTFWGKKPWTRKKKLLWQLGTLIGAPVGIALIAGLSIPGIIFGVPVFVGRKVHQRFSQHTKTRRRLITAACVAGSLVVSPVLAVMAVGVGVPIMLAYVYGVVPLSLCRNGGCGLRESQSMSNLENIDEEELYNASGIFGSHEKSQLLVDGESRADGQSLGPALSMQSGFSQSTQPTRLTVNNETRTRRQSVESGVASLGERANYEEASTKAMVGSQYHYDDKSVHTVCSAGQEALSYSEDVASTKALAGSVIDAKSLSGSMGARHVVSRADTVERERSEHPHDEKEDQPCSTKSLIEETPSGGLKSKRLSSSSRQQVVHMNVHGDDGNEIMILSEEAAAEIGALAASGDRESTTSATTEHDPFRIRTLMDTMKQMTAVDEAADHSAPPAPRPSGIGRLRRSNSSRSEATIENGISSPARAGKRRFFGLLPPKSARK